MHLKFIKPAKHLNLLEDFSPYRLPDPFRWIPQGLFYDLRDAQNENSPVVDQVSGYTNLQMLLLFNRIFILYKIIK